MCIPAIRIEKIAVLLWTAFTYHISQTVKVSQWGVPPQGEFTFLSSSLQRFLYSPSPFSFSCFYWIRAFYFAKHPVLWVCWRREGWMGVKRVVLPKVTNVLFQLSYDWVMAKCSRERTTQADACISASSREYLHILENRGDEEWWVKRKRGYAKKKSEYARLFLKCKWTGFYIALTWLSQSLKSTFQTKVKFTHSVLFSDWWQRPHYNACHFNEWWCTIRDSVRVKNTWLLLLYLSRFFRHLYFTWVSES